MTTLKICSQQPSTEGLITLEEVIAVNLHILTVKYHWQVLAISLQMQSPHLSLLHRNHVKKLTQLLFYTSIFYDHFSFHYRWNCYMSCWTACFLIWLFLCFTVSVHSSFIFIRSAKGWKRLSCMKVLVNYFIVSSLVSMSWFVFSYDSKVTGGSFQGSEFVLNCFSVFLSSLNLLWPQKNLDEMNKLL